MDTGGRRVEGEEVKAERQAEGCGYKGRLKDPLKGPGRWCGRLKVEHKLGLLRCRTQVEAFLRGLHEPLPRESMMRLSKFVSVAEVPLRAIRFVLAVCLCACMQEGGNGMLTFVRLGVRSWLTGRGRWTC